MDGQEPQNTSGGASAAGTGPGHGYHCTAAVARPRSGRSTASGAGAGRTDSPRRGSYRRGRATADWRPNTGLRVGVAAKAWRSRAGGPLDRRAASRAPPDLPLASGAVRHGARRGRTDVRGAADDSLPGDGHRDQPGDQGARLDSAIRTGVPPDPRTAALAALAHAVGLGKHLYPGNEGRSSRSRLRDLIRHDPMGGLVAHAVMDVQNGVAAQPRRSSAPAGRQGPADGRGAPEPARGVPAQPRRGSMARAVAH
ncbi:hypothetical protein RKD26_003778 [Streptomyces calvus]